MHIDITKPPSSDIPRLRWKYTRFSLFFLSLVICAIIIGVIGVAYNTGYDDILQNIGFFVFVGAGFAFVYVTEKLLGYRKLTAKQEEKLVGLAQEHEKVSEYWRQVAEQGRYIVVLEYDAIIAHVKSNEG